MCAGGPACFRESTPPGGSAPKCFDKEMTVSQRISALGRYCRDSVPGPLRYLFREKSLLRLLLRRDMVARTSGTIFGATWMLAQPALQILGLWFFLDVVLRVRSPTQVPFTEYFLLGMVAWLMIAEVLQRNLMVLVEFAPLYQRAVFPLPLLPLVPLLLTGMIYGTVLTILGGAFGGWRGAVSAAGFAAFLIVLLIPLSYLFAVIGLFVRESRQVVPFALTLMMYLTPIMYMPDLLPAAVHPWLVLNPLADLMALLHAAVQHMPWTAGNLWRPLLLGSLLWPLAWAVFRRTEPHMREAL